MSGWTEKLGYLVPSLTLTLIVSEILEKSLILWNKLSSLQKLRMLDYRISKETSKSKMVNVSMSAIISYPKNMC